MIHSPEDTVFYHRSHLFTFCCPLTRTSATKVPFITVSPPLNSARCWHIACAQ